jgi:hypothetical protein
MIAWGKRKNFTTWDYSVTAILAVVVVCTSCALAMLFVR